MTEQQKNTMALVLALIALVAALAATGVWAGAQTLGVAPQAFWTFAYKSVAAGLLIAVLLWQGWLPRAYSTAGCVLVWWFAALRPLLLNKAHIALDASRDLGMGLYGDPDSLAWYATDWFLIGMPVAGALLLIGLVVSTHR